MISVCILAKNAKSTLRATLDSVRMFPEVVLLDTGSTDSTLEIAREYSNVVIYEAPFTGFGFLRNQIARLAKNEWIFALDSDEVVSPSLADEILSLSLDTKIAYAIERQNFYNGKRIRGCGWGFDVVARLYHRSHYKYSEALVHESLQASSPVLLKSPLFHTPYRKTSEFLKKMEQYSNLFAEQNRGKKSSSLGSAIGHGLFAFLKSYFLKRGIFDGKEGFIISVYNANTAFYKYLKLREKYGPSEK